MEKGITWVGLDVHKKETSFAIMKPGDDLPVEGEIQTDPKKIVRLLRKQGRGSDVRVCYEAGPCGFDLKRRLDEAKIHCDVIAPSLIPKKAGDRVKTNRRDAAKLLRLYRVGELTPVRVPTEAEEAVRDLCRCREAAQVDLTRHRHQLVKFLLRHGRVYREGKAWTLRHWGWIRGQRFDDPNLTACFEAYLLQVEQAIERVKALDAELERVAETAPWSEAVGRLSSFRGIGKLSALVLAAEIGDFRRFAHPKNLMGYLGMVPGERSTGERRRQGSITKTGNSHARRVLVEAAWHYRHRPAVGKTLAIRQVGQSKEVRRESWKAQERLHLRYRRLIGKGKLRTVAAVAVARELSGFVWAAMTRAPATA